MKVNPKHPNLVSCKTYVMWPVKCSKLGKRTVLLKLKKTWRRVKKKSSWNPKKASKAAKRAWKKSKWSVKVRRVRVKTQALKRQTSPRSLTVNT